MTLLLNEIYPKSRYTDKATDRASDIVHGQFRIMGPGSQMLLPSLWERTIKPGWKVTFRFLNPKLNAIKEEQERPRSPGGRAAFSSGNKQKFLGKR
jgi:hypothetical protein